MPESAPTTRHPAWLLLLVVCIGQFMVVLDISIVNVALPSLQRDLRFSTSSLQWVVNAYALAFGGFLLLGGRAADFFGRRRVFLAGLGIFSGASLLCAMAQTETTLIAARAVQGLGAAVLAPATLTILTTVFTGPRERARALGIWSSMAAIGGASGALFGGILVDTLSWRWIFYVNVPIGIATIVAARVVVPESRGDVDRSSLDVLGAMTVTGGLVALVYAIAQTDTHPWGSTAVLGPLVVSILLLAMFTVVETRLTRAPLVPFRLFRSRSLVGANLVMLLVGGAMFSMWLFQSLYLQDVLRFSPLVAGLCFLPQTAAIATAAQISARLVPRTGPRTPLLVGVALAAVGLAWLSRVSPTGTYAADILGGSVLATFGMGLSMTPLAFAAMSGVAPTEAGLASGVLNTSRQIGGSVGLAALATAAATRTHALLAGAVPTPAHVAAALTSGFGRAFGLGALVALVGIPAAFLVPGRSRAPQGAGAPASHGHRPEPVS
ncbi:MAG TPA: MFS transporter, partial [Acidimicrobiales bacterium]|nr:MFS transporter [Acidimicrobiales bacterium]